MPDVGVELEVGVLDPHAADGLLDGHRAEPLVDQEALGDQALQRLERDPPVEHPHAVDDHRVRALVHAQPGGVDAVHAVSAGDRATLIASPAFDASVWEIWPYLAAGASIHIPDDETRMSPAKLVQWLADERITMSFLPTPLAEAALL